MASGWMGWFRVYAAELLSDERFDGWTLEERGAWLTLIAWAWREGSIPADPAAIARLLHVDGAAMQRIWLALSDRWEPHPTLGATRLVSPRLEEERSEAQKQREAKSEAGSKGAKSRWKKEKPEHGKRMTEPSRSKATAEQIHGPQPSTAQPSPAQPFPQTPKAPNAPEADDREAAQDEGGSLVEFRSELGEALGLGRMVDVGGDRPRVLGTFRAQLEYVGEGQLLRECLALAERSTSGPPMSLAWFEPWLVRLPDQPGRPS